MDDLVVWLRQQLDEDEAAAAAVAEIGLDTLIPAAVIDRSGATVYFAPEVYGRVTAVLDPARVLREVEAKRRIVAECLETLAREDAWDPQLEGGSGEEFEWARYALKMLALPYADCPGYQGQWKP